MPNVIDRRPGGGGASASDVTFFTESDGSYSQSQASALRGWNTTSLVWEKVQVNNSTAGLEVHVVGGSTGGTEYEEDAATPSPIKGIAILIERDDAPTTVTPAEADWIGMRGTEEGALWTQDFNSDAILTSVQLIDDAINGNEMQVDLVAITPDLMLGTDFSNVLGTSSLVLATQADDLANTSDGIQTTTFLYGYENAGDVWDRVQVNTSGQLEVDLATATATVTVTGDAAGSLTVDNAGLTELAAAITDSKMDVQLAGTDAVALNVSGATVTVTGDSGGSLTVDNAGLTELAAAINSSKLDIDIASSTVDVMLGSDFSNVLGSSSLVLATQADDVANTSDGLQTTSFLYGFENAGGVWDRVQLNTSGQLEVDIAATAATLTVELGATDNAVLDTIDAVLDAIKIDTEAIETAVEGTLTVTGDSAGSLTVDNAGLTELAAAITDSKMDVQLAGTDAVTIATTNAIVDGWDNAASDGATVSGDVAHSTTDAGEPVKVGGKAVVLLADPTEVATDERTDAYFTRAGQMFTIGGHPNTLLNNAHVTDADGAQTALNCLAGATGAGDVAVVTHLSVTLDEATTASTQFRIGFGASAPPAVDAADVIMDHPGLAAGSGMVLGNGGGILGIGAAGEDLFLDCEDPAGGNLSVTVGYFIIANG